MNEIIFVLEEDPEGEFNYEAVSFIGSKSFLRSIHFV